MRRATISSRPDAREPLPWHLVLEAVRTKHPSVYRSWFESLEPGRLDGGELRVVVPDAAWVHYLREHCAQAFAHAAMELTGHLISVHFQSQHGEDEQYDRGLMCLPLNPDYTFDEFVVGPSNRLAHAACRAVCTQPGTLYNPLFLHGAAGLGKTHLLQATCTELLRLEPGRRVSYVSCETFVNGFVQAIEKGDLHAFRDSARNNDLFVLDDVQFLANQESSQEEFFHTFNAIYQARRQIILSADSPPEEIPTLEDRLVSRFKWGLVAQIDPPNRETRQAILQKKARLRGYDAPSDALAYIAAQVESNIRVLEGALTKFVTENQLTGSPLTLETAQRLFPPRSVQDHRPLKMSDILQVVSRHFGIRLQELLGRKRTRSISYPRHIAIYLARRLTPLSLEEIGMHFDGRDHSTILHAERTIDADRQHNAQTAEVLAVLTRQLLSHP